MLSPQPGLPKVRDHPQVFRAQYTAGVGTGNMAGLERGFKVSKDAPAPGALDAATLVSQASQNGVKIAPETLARLPHPASPAPTANRS